MRRELAFCRHGFSRDRATFDAIGVCNLTVAVEAAPTGGAARSVPCGRRSESGYPFRNVVSSARAALKRSSACGSGCLMRSLSGPSMVYSLGCFWII